MNREDEEDLPDRTDELVEECTDTDYPDNDEPDWEYIK